MMYVRVAVCERLQASLSGGVMDSSGNRLLKKGQAFSEIKDSLPDWSGGHKLSQIGSTSLFNRIGG